MGREGKERREEEVREGREGLGDKDLKLHPKVHP